MRQEAGFSLIELLVVVAVLMVLVAIAIPNLLRAKIAANESSAVSAVRSVHTAQLIYNSVYPTVGYADSLTKLGPPASGMMPDPNHAGLLDFVLGCNTQPCSKTGYNLTIDQTSGSPIDSFRITATPQSFNRTGIRGFCSTKPGVITIDVNGGTNCSSAL